MRRPLARPPFPPSWQPALVLLQQLSGEPSILGGISVFDGGERNSRRISDSLTLHSLPCLSFEPMRCFNVVMSRLCFYVIRCVSELVAFSSM